MGSNESTSTVPFTGSSGLTTAFTFTFSPTTKWNSLADNGTSAQPTDSFITGWGHNETSEPGLPSRTTSRVSDPFEPCKEILYGGIGFLIGVLVTLTIVAIVLWCLHCQKRKRQDSARGNGSTLANVMVLETGERDIAERAQGGREVDEDRNSNEYITMSIPPAPTSNTRKPSKEPTYRNQMNDLKVSHAHNSGSGIPTNNSTQDCDQSKTSLVVQPPSSEASTTNAYENAGRLEPIQSSTIDLTMEHCKIGSTSF